MIYLPNINNYDLNALVAIGDKIEDERSRSKYRSAIAEKILSFNYGMFFLIKKFMYSKTILKEAYADVILMKMKGNDYEIDDALVNEILTYSSLDALMYYGADSLSYEFNKKCKDEFYRRGYELEDKIEFQRKKYLGKKLIINFKKKGDRK